MLIYSGLNLDSVNFLSTVLFSEKNESYFKWLTPRIDSGNLFQTVVKFFLNKLEILFKPPRN